MYVIVGVCNSGRSIWARFQPNVYNSLGQSVFLRIGRSTLFSDIIMMLILKYICLRRVLVITQKIIKACHILDIWPFFLQYQIKKIVTKNLEGWLTITSKQGRRGRIIYFCGMCQPQRTTCITYFSCSISYIVTIQLKYGIMEMQKRSINALQSVAVQFRAFHYWSLYYNAVQYSKVIK